MNESYLYLWVNILSISLPFIFSFHKLNPFYRKWRYVWPAIVLPAVFFVVWDIWFTHMGVWGFNPRYLSGVYLSNLPIEEVLFFICIPYACAFTYESVNILSGRPRISNRAADRISEVLTAVLLILAVIFIDKWYTSSAFIVAAATIAVNRWWLRSAFMGRFYFAFLFILIPFFIVNGVLTGTGIPEEVVWYNAHEFMGLRMGTIPVEDTFYGMSLLLMNITIYERLQSRAAG